MPNFGKHHPVRVLELQEGFGRRMQGWCAAMVSCTGPSTPAAKAPEVIAVRPCESEQARVRCLQREWRKLMKLGCAVSLSCARTENEAGGGLTGLYGSCQGSWITPRCLCFVPL